MKKIIRSLLSTALLLLSTGNSQAITLSFDPVAQNMTVGHAVDVALKISGLVDTNSPSLGTYDLDISFDPGVLSFSSASFGDPILGDQLDVLGLGVNPTFAGITSAGVLNLFELSLDFATDLNNLQAGSFTLATLTFDTHGVGTSALGISITSLGDANGDPLTAGVANGSITVPEPAMLPLLGSGLFGFIWMRRKNNWNQS